MQLLAKGVKPIDVARSCRWFFLFLSLWGPFSVWRALQKVEQNAEVLRYLSTTQGEITYVKLTGKGAPTLDYVYEVMGKTYNGVTEPDVRPNYWQDPRVGDSIDVSFSTKHPNRSMAGDRKRQPDYSLSVDLGWVFLVIGLIGLAASQWSATHLKESEPTKKVDNKGEHLRESKESSQRKHD